MNTEMTVLKVVVIIDIILLGIACIVLPIGAYCLHKAHNEARETISTLVKTKEVLKDFVGKMEEEVKYARRKRRYKVG